MTSMTSSTDSDGPTFCGSKLNHSIRGHVLSGLRFPLPASIAISSPPKSCPEKPATRRSPPGAGDRVGAFPGVSRTAGQHGSGPANAARSRNGSSGSAWQFRRRASRAPTVRRSEWQPGAAQPGPSGLRASAANSSWRPSKRAVFLSPARLAHWHWTQIAASLNRPAITLRTVSRRAYRR